LFNLNFFINIYTCVYYGTFKGEDESSIALPLLLIQYKKKVQIIYL